MTIPLGWSRITRHVRSVCACSSVDRVPGYEPVGRRFESCQARQAGAKFALLRRFFISARPSCCTPWMGWGFALRAGTPWRGHGKRRGKPCPGAFGSAPHPGRRQVNAPCRAAGHGCGRARAHGRRRRWWRRRHCRTGCRSGHRAPAWSCGIHLQR